MRRAVALLLACAAAACASPPAPTPDPGIGRDAALRAVTPTIGMVGTLPQGIVIGAAVAPWTAVVRGTVPIQLPPADRTTDQVRLRTYILATDPVSVPRATLAAAVCAWRFGLDVERAAGPVSTEAAVAAEGDLNLMILPVREERGATAEPRAFLDAYDHDRARVLLGRAGIRADGLFIVTAAGSPLDLPDAGAGQGRALVVETLTGWSPDLVHAWLRETRRRVREPGGWSRPSLEQRLLQVANALDMAGSFAGPFFRLAGVANAEARAPALPEPCG